MITAPAIDYNSAVIEQVLPDAASILGVFNTHITTNFRAGYVSSASFLSAFRLAMLVVNEPSAMILTRYKYLGNTPT